MNGVGRSHRRLTKSAGRCGRWAELDWFSVGKHSLNKRTRSQTGGNEPQHGSTAGFAFTLTLLGSNHKSRPSHTNPTISNRGQAARAEPKGNIRVFCRVRPLLLEDGPGAEATISYAISIESVGRGIDLIQNGQKHHFTFDKVFAHNTSQQEVFIEISQLVQNALSYNHQVHSTPVSDSDKSVI
ncbi:Kinesin, motor domain-containing protein [Cynara cardunculus var. scolymus]|uniref:Kinesin, motor domain-containing protein n=1 Tax=Cynara cardunculus var. scolymus TaxID=59895 RepID=A0A103Y206_CYNCS|nr:Kinesin, motor domain-containing protein [Cynara cardunculus var. scolymus]